MYVLDLMHVHVHNDHMCVYDFCFVLMFIVYYVKCHDSQIIDMHVQLLRSPMFIWTHMLCSHHYLAIMYIMILIQQLSLFGLGKKLIPMDPKEYGYQRPPLLYLMQVWALASRESGGTLKWMRSVLKRKQIWMHHFQGELGGRGPPLVWKTREVPSSVLVSISNSHFYLHAFTSLIYSMSCLLFIMPMPCLLEQ